MLLWGLVVSTTSLLAFFKWNPNIVLQQEKTM